MRKVLLTLLSLLSLTIIGFNIYLYKINNDVVDIAKETKQEVLNNINNEKRPGLVLKNSYGDKIAFDYNDKLIYLNDKVLCKINEITDEYIKTDKGDIDVNIDPRVMLVEQNLELRSVKNDRFSLSVVYNLSNYESYYELVTQEVTKLVGEDFKNQFNFFEEETMTLNVEGEEFSFGDNQVFAISNLDDAKFLSRNMKCVTSFCSS